MSLIQRLNQQLYRPATLWDIALFVMNRDEDILNHDYSYPQKVFSPKKLRTKKHYTTGFADPFLFVHEDYLYLFYEKELFQKPGVIAARRTKDLKTWQNLGVVLKEPFHLSYPNVFRYNGEIYMLPETGATETVTLYKATDFPFHWEKHTILLKGHQFADSDIFHRDGVWYLITTIWRKDSHPGLQLYTAPALTGPYKLHQSAPLSRDFKNMRCGGKIMEINGRLFRPAQKCDEYYGENLALCRIDALSPSDYAETFVRYMNSRDWDWSRKGGHHFNTVNFDGKQVVVMDGKIKDSWVNNRTRDLFE